MALIKCVECGKDISDTTEECIHCGAPTSISIKGNPKRYKKFIVFIIVGILILILIIVSVPFVINHVNRDLMTSSTLSAEYSAPEMESIYGDAMRAIFKFDEDGTVTFQRCNLNTDTCAEPHSYTYKKHSLDIDIYSSLDYRDYDCLLKHSGKFLRCDDMSGRYQDYAKID